jgi:hypothetical protein
MKNISKSFQVFLMLVFLMALISNSHAAQPANKNAAFCIKAKFKSLVGKPNPIDPLIRLRLGKGTFNYDEILIRMDASALESLSTRSSDSVLFAISSAPYPGIKQKSRSI